MALKFVFLLNSIDMLQEEVAYRLPELVGSVVNVDGNITYTFEVSKNI